MFTRREKIVAVIGGLALILFFLFPQLVNSDYEFLYLLVVVVPVGLLLATDPERIAKSK